MKEYIERYLNWCALKGETEDSLYRKRTTLLFLANHIDLKSIRAVPLEEFCLQNFQSLSPHTYNSKIGIIRSFYKYLIKLEVVSYNPAESVDSKEEDDKDQRCYTDDEVKAFLNVGYIRGSSKRDEEKYKLIFMVIIATGCRASEALSLLKKDIRTDKGNAWIIFRKTKNNRDYSAPIEYDFAVQLLKFVIKDNNMSEYVFTDKSGSSLNYSAVMKAFQRRAKRVGIIRDGDKYVGLHGFRRSRITRLLEANNGNVVEAKLLHGHEKISTTMKYFYGGNNTSYLQKAAMKDPMFNITKFVR